MKQHDIGFASTIAKKLGLFVLSSQQMKRGQKTSVWAIFNGSSGKEVASFFPHSGKLYFHGQQRQFDDFRDALDFLASLQQG